MCLDGVMESYVGDSISEAFFDEAVQFPNAIT